MGETFSKKQINTKKNKKKKEKSEKREFRKTFNNKGKDINSMIAYLDEDGNITSTPPEKQNSKKP